MHSQHGEHAQACRRARAYEERAAQRDGKGGDVVLGEHRGALLLLAVCIPCVHTCVGPAALRAIAICMQDGDLG